MEFLLEVLLELILEGSIELSSNKKVPKPIRYFLIIFIILFFLAFILGFCAIGILIYKKNKIGSLIIIGIGLLLLITCIYTFKEKYLILKSRKNK